MLIENKKTFYIGILYSISFFAVLVVIFSPIFGGGRNGLVFSDDMFNKLSKGSSYFIPKIMKANEKNMGKQFSVTVTLDKPEDAQKAAEQFKKAGSEAQADAGTLKLTGDLGKTLGAILKDADSMFNNNSDKLKADYGYDGKDVLNYWWQALSKMDKALKKDGKIAESKEVGTVMKKAVEPAYNFFGVESQKVSDKIGIMTGLLVFYVVYTMWWGFAIYYLFEGIGFSMKKAKVKKEV
ncbi:hypothetical protein [Candidatus Magnetominusculus xianensis]|uniref:Uncharacterized protein n=1 Tax=Candidatus Magnetominusculus xianensis TaxID=1748249 RepID=A0ABR5SC32_9BACT|nr:hypothetical protein [Candidatus Magnetominusculus xianensis]KWT78989.1 hypothetical protein ASN18_2786 [Candidatus Magnetominusculus xianensis]MBF0405004.1 hypothetical protein [Nitrospirota bacterium]